MQKITAKRGFSILLALALLLLMGVAIRGVHWQAATIIPPKGSEPNDSISAGAKTNLARDRDSVGPGSQPNSQQGVREDDLLTLEDYWNTRVTYPTGQFNMNWLLNADKQNRAVSLGDSRPARLLTAGPPAIAALARSQPVYRAWARSRSRPTAA